MGNEFDDMQLLNSSLVFKELADHLRDLLVSVQSIGVTVTRCVDDGHWSDFPLEIGLAFESIGNGNRSVHSTLKM